MAEKKFFDMSPAERLADLSVRVCHFNMMALPGQPQGMHMGTSYLVNDLWKELTEIPQVPRGLGAKG